MGKYLLIAAYALGFASGVFSSDRLRAGAAWVSGRVQAHRVERAIAGESTDEKRIEIEAAKREAHIRDVDCRDLVPACLDRLLRCPDGSTDPACLPDPVRKPGEGVPVAGSPLDGR